MSDDFKDGYQQGFKDGYDLGKKGWEQSKFSPAPKGCSVCGMSFFDEMGRPRIMGYVCSHPKCPSRITCAIANATFTNFTGNVVENVGHVHTMIRDPGPLTAGLSYEEIYGSVIYQQNNKKEE